MMILESFVVMEQGKDMIDSQVCFYRRLFIDAVKPRECISWPWGASIGLHGVPGCSSRQSWPPLCIVTRFVPQTEGTALPFESEWLLWPARLRLPTPLYTRSVILHSLALPDPLLTGAYRLEIISESPINKRLCEEGLAALSLWQRETRYKISSI